MAASAARLLLFIAGVFALAAVTAMAAIIKIDYDGTRRDSLQRNVVLAQLLEEHAHRTFDLGQAALNDLIGGVTLGPGGVGVTPAMAARAARWLRDAPQISAFLVIDETGRVVFTTLAGNPNGVDLSDRPYFKAHAAGEKIHVGGLTLGRIEKKWFFSLSRRVEDGDGRFRGLVVASMRAGYFSTLYAGLGLAPGDNIAIYKTDGTVVARRLMNWRGDIVPSSASHPLFTTYFPQAAQGTYQAVSPIDGVTRIGAYRGVEGWPLIVTSVSDIDQVLAPWIDRSRRNATFCLALLAALAGLAWWGYQRMRGEERAVEATRKARDAAEAANRTKSEFIASISHEFRTPLNAVIGFSDALRSGAIGETLPPRCLAYVGDIHAAGQHLLDLVNDVLDVSVIEASKLDLRPETVAVGPMIDAVLRLVQARATAKSLALDVDLDRAPPSLLVDERRCKQILVNLLGNAVKFTHDGGVIRLIVIAVVGGGVDLVVADTGIGMDEAGLAKALTFFGQVDSSLARKYEGTGLGLPLAKSLIELHGGTLDIDSAPGRGTTVTVHLPPACVPAAATAV